MMSPNEVDPNQGIEIIKSDYYGCLLNNLLIISSFGGVGSPTTETFEFGFQNLQRRIPFLWIKIRGCISSQGELEHLKEKKIQSMTGMKRQFFLNTELIKFEQFTDKLVFDFLFSDEIISRIILSHPEEVVMEC